MSKKDKTTSNFLNEAKSVEENDKQSNETNGQQIKRDRTYITPDEFKSKSPKKDNQAFFVSRINKPAKYTKDSNFFSYLVYRVVGVKQSTIRDLIKDHVPSDYAPQVSSIIGDIMDNASGGLLSIGLIAALWSASNGMTALMNAFNVAYDVEDSRNFVVAKLYSVLFTLAMIIVMPVALVLPTFGQQIGDLLFGPLGLGDQVKWLFDTIRFVLPVIVVLIAFMVLYTLAPNVKIKLLSVIPGAIFATIVFLGGSYLFGFYISNFANYSKTYGSIAGIIILMLWLYITGFIIIIGAEINAIFHQRKVVRGKTPEEQTLDDIEHNRNTSIADNQDSENKNTDITSSNKAVNDVDTSKNNG